MDRSRAVEVGQAAAGLLDDDERRGEVPGRWPDLDHRLRGALGHQRVPPEVAEAALAPDVAEQRVEPGRPPAVARCPRPSRTAAARPRPPTRATPRSDVVGRRPGRPPRPPTRRRRATRTSARRAPAPRSTPAWSSPSASTPSNVPNSGTPRMKLCGPVDRVDVPADRRLAASDRRIPRRRGRGRECVAAIRSRIIRSIAVSACGHERRSGLRVDLEVAPEVPQGDRVGLVAGARANASQASSSASARRSPSRRSVRHERIRSPFGSYSGSRATSKPTHSPNTSTSPRVPMRPVRRQVGVGDRALDREAVAARGHPADDSPVDPDRLVAEADRTRIVEDEAAQPLARAGRPSRASSASRPMKSTPLSSATANPRPASNGVSSGVMSLDQTR